MDRAPPCSLAPTRAGGANEFHPNQKQRSIRVAVDTELAMRHAGSATIALTVGGLSPGLKLVGAEEERFDVPHPSPAPAPPPKAHAYGTLIPTSRPPFSNQTWATH